HYWIGTPSPGAKRKTTGASKGDRSKALARSRLHEFRECGLCAGVKRNRARRKALAVKLQYLDILSRKDFETAFRDAAKGRADAVLFRVAGPSLSAHRTEVAALAAKSQLPVIYESAEEVDAGGLMSYGVNANDLYRRAATYVDKILKGAKPAELPVEQPTKFEFVINLKAAKQIGLTIPPNVLVRADRVIKEVVAFHRIELISSLVLSYPRQQICQAVSSRNHPAVSNPARTNNV